jgi:hypothetical protein|tara:strand:- start:126 stop:329 length:204 start_codon:yes stop_codon:yes gene_type:complete
MLTTKFLYEIEKNNNSQKKIRVRSSKGKSWYKEDFTFQGILRANEYYNEQLQLLSRDVISGLRVDII